MKFYWCMLLLITQISFAQSTTGEDEEGKANPVAGDPYLLKEWSDGQVYFSSGRILTQFKLKFNVARNQLIMQFQGSTFAAESKATGFTLYTGSRKKRDSIVFRKGFPATEKANTETFYQVLLEGKAVLLRLFVKQVVEDKQLLASHSTTYFRDEEEYYLFQDGKMLRLPSDREDILKLLPDPSGSLASFVKQEEFKFRGAEDYIRLIRQYNVLNN